MAVTGRPARLLPRRLWLVGQEVVWGPPIPSGVEHEIVNPTRGREVVTPLGLRFAGKDRLFAVRVIDNDAQGSCSDLDLHGRYYFLPLRYGR